MKTRLVLKITALACVAVFALSVLIYGLSTGFGFKDLFKRPDADGKQTTYTYEEELEYLDALRIDWVSGPVKLSFYEGEKVLVKETARHELDESEKLELEISGGTLRINWDRAAFHIAMFGVSEKALEVQLPQAFAEDLGGVSVKTASGDIVLDTLSVEDASFETASGNIYLENIKAETLRVGSVSGDIRGKKLTGTQELKAGSVSGSMTLSELTGEKVKLDTTSGRIDAAGVKGETECDSVSGDVGLAFAKPVEKLEIDTVSGNVNVTMPESAGGFTCKFSSVSGDFTSGFETTKSGDKYICGKGTAEIKISTTSGDAALNRAE